MQKNDKKVLTIKSNFVYNFYVLTKNNIKLILYSVILILTTAVVFKVNFCFADTSVFYARIINPSTMLYEMPTLESQPLFKLPQTYFVEILDKENDTFYSARFCDIQGFVKIGEVQFVKNEPLNKFPKQQFVRAVDKCGLDLRSSPTTVLGTQNILKVIPYLYNNIIFYGFVDGEDAIPQNTRSWIFCKYVFNEEKTNIQTFECGFLYSFYCDNFSPKIPNNTELSEVIEAPSFEKIIESGGPGNPILTLSPVIQGVVVVALCLPCLALIYFLRKPTKLVHEQNIATQKTLSSKKIKKSKGSDYYEID
ncbi:MAG: hypothetical protein RR140_00355 [Clostridia bacterium]